MWRDNKSEPGYICRGLILDPPAWQKLVSITEVSGGYGMVGVLMVLTGSLLAPYAWNAICLYLVHVNMCIPSVQTSAHL